MGAREGLFSFTGKKAIGCTRAAANPQGTPHSEGALTMESTPVGSDRPGKTGCDRPDPLKPADGRAPAVQQVVRGAGQLVEEVLDVVREPQTAGRRQVGADLPIQLGQPRPIPPGQTPTRIQLAQLVPPVSPGLDEAVTEWEDSGEHSGYLLRGRRLAQFDQWAADTDIALMRPT